MWGNHQWLLRLNLLNKQPRPGGMICLDAHVKSYWCWITSAPRLLLYSPALVAMGILQNMVNPSLGPTQPEGSELPTFRYGGESIPRVLKQYRFSTRGYIFPAEAKLWVTHRPSRVQISEPCAPLAPPCGHYSKATSQHIEAEAIWPSFSRRHFQTHLLEWKCINFA